MARNDELEQFFDPPRNPASRRVTPAMEELAQRIVESARESPEEPPPRFQLGGGPWSAPGERIGAPQPPEGIAAPFSPPPSPPSDRPLGAAEMASPMLGQEAGGGPWRGPAEALPEPQPDYLPYEGGPRGSQIGFSPSYLPPTPPQPLFQPQQPQAPQRGQDFHSFAAPYLNMAVAAGAPRHVYDRVFEQAVHAHLTQELGRVQLSQAERQRMSRLQTAQDQLQQMVEDGQISREDARALMFQVQNNVNPLQQRHQQSQILMEQERTNMIRRESQLRTELLQHQLNELTGTMNERIHQYVDPNTGQVTPLTIDARTGTIHPLRTVGGAGAGSGAGGGRGAGGMSQTDASRVLTQLMSGERPQIAPPPANATAEQLRTWAANAQSVAEAHMGVAANLARLHSPQGPPPNRVAMMQMAAPGVRAGGNTPSQMMQGSEAQTARMQPPFEGLHDAELPWQHPADSASFPAMRDATTEVFSRIAEQAQGGRIDRARTAELTEWAGRLQRLLLRYRGLDRMPPAVRNDYDSLRTRLNQALNLSRTTTPAEPQVVPPSTTDERFRGMAG